MTRAHRMAAELEAGYVWINGSSRHYWGLPFGGFKASGVGREESVDELLSYSRNKSRHGSTRMKAPLTCPRVDAPPTVRATCPPA